METKTISMLGILALFLAFSSSAETTQYLTLQSGGSFQVQTNQLVSIIGFGWGDGNNRPRILGSLSNGTSIDLSPCYTPSVSSGTGATAFAQIPQMATGMTNIQVTGGVGPGWATFKITNPIGDNVVSNYVPADAIVIPASVTGNVQIILESSPDLVNWTAANPGTYGASAGTNRFFRVRAAVSH